MTTLELNLTDDRRSLWEALDLWYETTDVFVTKFKWEEDVDQIDDDGPSLSDLPAISIEPLSTQPEWWTHEMMEFPVAYSVKIWTQDWAFPEPEDLVERVQNAFYRACLIGSSMSVIKKATGMYPKVGPITFKFSDPSQSPKTVLTEMFVTLDLRKDPFAP